MRIAGRWLPGKPRTVLVEATHSEALHRIHAGPPKMEGSAAPERAEAGAEPYPQELRVSSSRCFQLGKPLAYDYGLLSIKYGVLFMVAFILGCFELLAVSVRYGPRIWAQCCSLQAL